jgi:hypothetical protein
MAHGEHNVANFPIGGDVFPSPTKDPAQLSHYFVKERRLLKNRSAIRAPNGPPPQEHGVTVLVPETGPHTPVPQGRRGPPFSKITSIWNSEFPDSSPDDARS